MSTNRKAREEGAFTEALSHTYYKQTPILKGVERTYFLILCNCNVKTDFLLLKKKLAIVNNIPKRWASCTTYTLLLRPMIGLSFYPAQADEGDEVLNRGQRRPWEILNQN